MLTPASASSDPRRRFVRLRRSAGGLVAAVLLALGAAALVDGMRGGESRPAAAPAGGRAALEGPLVPAPGALPGGLVLAVGEACRLALLDLGTLALGPQGAATSCALWAARSGHRVLVARGDPRRVYDLWLASLGEPPSLLRRLGRARGEPAWSADGGRVAWCTPSRSTRVLELGAAATTVPGCGPRFGPDGRVLTRPDRAGSSTLLRDGRVLLDEQALRRGFGAGAGSLELLGFDERRDGLLAVAVARFGGRRPEVLLELWRGGRLERALPLPLRVMPAVGPLGDRIRFSPDGARLAVAFSRDAFGLVLVDVRSGRTIVPAARGGAFAWSPDGRWLALATGAEVVVVAATTGEAVYTLPLHARAVAWR